MPSRRKSDLVFFLLLLFAAGTFQVDDVIIGLTILRDFRDELPRVIQFSRSHNFTRVFSIQDYSDYDFKVRCRFQRTDLPKLIDFFDLRESYTTINGSKVSGEKALVITLWRLSSHGPWALMALEFGMNESELTMIFHAVIRDIIRSKQQLLRLPSYYTHPPNLRRFARAIYRKGHHHNDVVAFIDGTCLRICRPKRWQRVMYSGHKRYHCLKWQHVVFPDGMIALQHGPYEGRQPDQWMWNRTHMDHLGSTRFRFTLTPENEADHVPLVGAPLIRDAFNRIYYKIFGDSGYSSRHPFLMKPFRQWYTLTPAQKAYNAHLSKCRIAAEWSFGKLFGNFTFLDDWKQLRTGQRPVGQYFIAAALLCNVHTCLYGSETSQYFGVFPPTLEQYKQMAATGTPAAAATGTDVYASDRGSGSDSDSAAASSDAEGAGPVPPEPSPIPVVETVPYVDDLSDMESDDDAESTGFLTDSDQGSDSEPSV